MKVPANTEHALECYTQALELARRVGDRVSESGALTNLGIMHAILGSTEEADGCYRQSLAIDRQIGDRAAEGYDLFNLADLHMERNELAAAEEFLRAALESFDAAESSQGRAIAMAALGEVMRRQGQLAEARCVLDEALALLRDGWDNQQLFLLHCYRTLCFSDLCEHANAQLALQEAERLGATLGVDTQLHLGRALDLARHAACKSPPPNSTAGNH